MKFDVRQILSVPAVYTWFQRLVRGRCDQIYVTRHVRPRVGDRVLDIGCGTGDLLRHMPRVEYVGFDADQRVIDAAVKKYGDRGRLLCKDLTQVQLDKKEPFDLVLATAVLHHLDDAQATQLLGLARRFLRSEGRLVTLDGCFVQGQSFLSRWILSMDRGKHVRRKEEYVRLAGTVFEHVEATVYHDLLRIPSAILVMECSH